MINSADLVLEGKVHRAARGAIDRLQARRKWPNRLSSDGASCARSERRWLINACSMTTTGRGAYQGLSTRWNIAKLSQICVQEV